MFNRREANTNKIWIIAGVPINIQSTFFPELKTDLMSVLNKQTIKGQYIWYLLKIHKTYKSTKCVSLL